MTELDVALARAVVSRVLKIGLSFPNQESFGQISSVEAEEALSRAAVVLDEVDEVSNSNTLTGLTEAVARFRAPSLTISTVGDLGQDYDRLFGHTLRGKVCPYETEYGGAHTFQQAQELSDLAGFYLAFGLKPSDARNERVDHIAHELEFLEFLSCKEAYAWEDDDEDMLAVTRGALKRFVGEHLGRFGRAFGRHLHEADTGGFYGGLGGLCAAFLSSECERQGTEVGPEVLELRSTEEEDVPMACGTGSTVDSVEETSFEV
jgi:TorA maturation chaperone TorD